LHGVFVTGAGAALKPPADPTDGGRMRAQRLRLHEWVLCACVLALLGAAALCRTGSRLAALHARDAAQAAPTVFAAEAACTATPTAAQR
jgi:hypothetical protein